MLPRAYLAGPMSSYPQFNFPAFIRAAANLREVGWDIISPAEIDDPEDFLYAMASPDGAMGNTPSGKTWGQFLSRDVKIVADDVQALILLPEWEKSRGAKLEVTTGLLSQHVFFEYLEDGPVWWVQDRSAEYISQKLANEMP